MVIVTYVEFLGNIGDCIYCIIACPVGETLNLKPFGQVIINLRNTGPVSAVESRESVAFTAEGSPFMRQVMMSSWGGSIMMP